MKKIEFTSPADGDVINDPNIDMLKILFLYVGKEFWNSGSGDNCIDFYENETETRLQILFSEPHGFYLRYMAKGKDFHSSTELDYSAITTIHVGGNPLVLPVKFFIAREKAFEIVQYFCSSGERLTSHTWIENANVTWDWEKHLI